MNTILVAGAAVTGARHLRVARNGQDAAAAWAGAGMGAVVVCDGCSAGASSEVGARLGAQLVIAQVAARLSGGERPRALWSGVRAQVVAALGQLARAMPGDPAAVIREHFLFTIVAAVVAGDEACVWAIGDGAYAFRVERTPGGAPDVPDRSVEVARGPLHVLGPFADNQPPYLAYDLLGMPAAAHLDARDACAGQIVVATDGAAELDGALFDGLLEPRTLAHPDGLRRRLAVAARSGERIDWTSRRIVRTPAALQDDGAIAVLGWAP
jgi:hypothetical protein